MEVFRRKAPEGHLYALDVDPIEIVKTGERLQKAGYGEEILTILQQNFANLETVAKEYGPFDFMLADLGVSSMQIDDPKRGFSYKADGPLDLRLDPQHGIPASQRLRELNREELIGMLVENSDEPYAEQIASEICKTFKKGGSMDTTTALREAIERALCFLPENKEKKDILKKTCQRVFQALRIDVNSEFEVLEAFLNALPEALADGGRVAILTFHSGEDRLVKKAFQQYYREGIFEEIATDVIRPTAEECRQNGRARSTKMRWAVIAHYYFIIIYCVSYIMSRMVLGNLMTEWLLQFLWQNDSCKVYDRMVPGNLMTEWFLEISWQLITPETEWLGIIS